jgi:hypothetical protein
MFALDFMNMLNLVLGTTRTTAGQTGWAMTRTTSSSSIILRIYKLEEMSKREAESLQGVIHNNIEAPSLEG